MNNSCFGKTCEDVWRYKKLHIFTGEDKIKKLQRKINSPFFQTVKIYDEYTAAVQMKTQQVNLNKPRYVGQCILALSKTVMVNFHYNIMMKYFSHDQIKLGFTDTDSLCYSITCKEDIYSKSSRRKFCIRHLIIWSLVEQLKSEPRRHQTLSRIIINFLKIKK